MAYEELNFEEYERQCELRRQENEKYLKAFQSTLETSGLSRKTIDGHLSNVDFYLNTFLLREEPCKMEEGMSGWWVEEYFGDFFIRKCMWSTPGNMKTTAASVKKFYKCMADLEYVDREEYQDMCAYIKENMKQWQEDCARYNDPDEDDPFGDMDKFFDGF